MATQGSTNESPSPKADFRTLKCSQCQKYLSGPPIYTYTNPENDENKNVCGRCKVPEGGHIIRNKSLEALARHLHFPCSISKKCPDKMKWGYAKEHKNRCAYRKSRCPLCQSAGIAYMYIFVDLKNHFLKYHQQEYISNKSLIITEKDVYNKTYASAYFVDFEQILCLVHVNVIEWELRIKIESTSSSIPSSFDVSFSKTNYLLSFKSNLIWDESNWKEHQFDIKKIREILMPDKSMEFSINLEILCEEAELCKVNEVTLKEEIAKALECPICMYTMTPNISICTRGHSICNRCKALTDRCPICRLPHGTAHNLALEEVARTFVHF